MKIKNLVEESIKEVSQKINVQQMIYVEIWGCYSGNNKRFK